MELDEHLLTNAKLREQVRGDLDGGEDLHSVAGLFRDRTDLSVLSFVDDALDGELEATDLGATVAKSLRSKEVTEAVHEGRGGVLSHYVGVTEQELDGSALRLPLQIDEWLTNHDATAFVAGVGNPNTGKTNHVALLAELRKTTTPELLIISNSRTWEFSDLVVTGAHDLATTLLEHRDRPKFVFIDEGSTHFDARTHSHEVAAQFSPLAKRFAKIDVDVFATVGHTGKDLHPELKRLVTLAFWKHTKKELEYFEDWPADSDSPTDRLLGSSVEDLEPAIEEPDPDDSAPWRWDLRSDLFAHDLDWSELLDRLVEIGPKT